MRRAGLFAAALLAVALPAAAQRQEQARLHRAKALGISLAVDDTWPPVGPGVLYPVRIELVNEGGQDRRVAIRWQGQIQPDEVRRELVLSAGETARFTLLVPRAGRHMVPELSVEVDGEEVKELRDEMRGWYNIESEAEYGPGRARGHGILLVEDGVPDLRGINALYSMEARWIVHLTPDRLSEKWQAYDGLQIIAVNAKVWPRLAPEHSRAILSAVRAGGTLVLFGDPGAGGPVDGRLGLGRVKVWSEDPYSKTGTAWVQEPPEREGKRLVEKSFRIPGVGEIPLNGLRVTLFVFVVLVGPVNILVTAYLLKKRALLLVTTPALALLGSGILLVLSFVSEGFSVRSRTVSWTWLDRENDLAIIRSESVLYAGLAPSEGLVFDPGTAVHAIDRSVVLEEWDRKPSPYGYPHHYGYPYGEPEESGRAYEIDWSEGQALRSGGLPSRRLTWLFTGQVVPVRAELVLEKTGDGGYELVNGLPVAIRSGYVVRSSSAVLGRSDLWHLQGPVEPGGRGSLAPGGPSSRLPEDVPAWVGREVAKEPGEFFVVLSSNPWLDLGLEETEAEEDFHFLSGRLEFPGP
ncbi:MAG: hypothetical protein HY720_30530 [Planctomycetes bacterium]|nr:hypothetical protein [Planctomycetota bacterium]